MNSIKLKLFLLMSAIAGANIFFAILTYSGFAEFREQRRQLELSRDLTQRLIQSENQFAGAINIHKEIRNYIPLLHPPRRSEELEKLLMAAQKGRVSETRERHQVLVKNEFEFQRHTRDQLSYLEDKTVYFGLLCIFSLLVGLVLLQIYINTAVLRPLRDLARKMNDFLHDRYTYQFSVPGSDELGRMQATFNALAQRVISNMEQLRTLDQAKSDFLSIASHELRTPLTSIKGSISLMRSGIVGTINEMADNLLNIAEQETDRLIRLINDILDLAKIEAQRASPQPEWSSMNSLVTISLQSLKGLADQAEVKLLAEAMPPLEVNMDRDRIQQVLTNLLSNAIKFSPKGGCVIVHCEINNQHQLVIEVRDQGRGIDPQDQEAIFEKFRQATSANNPLVKGTGLGLAIAKALVEQHGGDIGVRSFPGEGSTFYFTLPEWRYSSIKNLEAAA